jgi:DNA-binding transcriptional ArsR family regulator
MSSSLNRASMGNAALEMIAERFRALGEPNRLRLLISLEQGEQCVGHLVEATGLSQANVSRHLGALVQSGILARRKAGLKVFYRVADSSIFEMCDHVCGSLAKRLATQASIIPGGNS